MTVVYKPQAVEDLLGAPEHIARDNPGAAVRLRERIFMVIGRLAAGVYKGQRRRFWSGETVQSWLVRPYRIYYLRSPNRLTVLRIYHQARRPITM